MVWISMKWNVKGLSSSQVKIFMHIFTYTLTSAVLKWQNINWSFCKGSIINNKYATFEYKTVISYTHIFNDFKDIKFEAIVTCNVNYQYDSIASQYVTIYKNKSLNLEKTHQDIQSRDYKETNGNCSFFCFL